MDVITGPISAADFYHNYLIKNKPCIIDNGLIKPWKCLKDWRTSDDQINFDFLKDNFGHSTVTVSNCKQKYYNSQVTEDMNFRQYLKYWKNVIDCDHNYSNNECLYLKDWHFMIDYPEYEAYITPDLFTTDWLNEYCLAESKSDYRFVYMGPKGSSTPLHKDVFSSFSWSANIVGQKEWILIPPGKESELSMPDGHLPFDVKQKLKSQEFKDYFEVIEVVQDAGQVIFVPSGWIHQVLNTKDTISINHNWFNECNLNFIYDSMHQALLGVQKELQDLRSQETLSEWQDECQTILRLHHGMNLTEFQGMLKMVIGRLRNESKINDTEEKFRIEHEISTLRTFLGNNQIFNELQANLDYLLSDVS